MSIYAKFIQEVEQKGKPFHVCLEKREMRIGNKWLIRDGKYEGELIDNPGEDAVTEIERLYHQYKHSLPSRKSRDKYFKALSAEELDEADWYVGEQREIAQARLEGYVLCLILLDKLHIDGWFWKSKTEPDLVILADWVNAK